MKGKQKHVDGIFERGRAEWKGGDADDVFEEKLREWRDMDCGEVCLESEAFQREMGENGIVEKCCIPRLFMVLTSPHLVIVALGLHRTSPCPGE